MWLIQVTTTSISPDMTTVFHARSYLDLQQASTERNFIGWIKGSDFPEGSFTNRDKEEPQSNLEDWDDFPSRTDPPIFPSIATELLHWPYETSWAFPTLK